jgi:hypothetical protein
MKEQEAIERLREHIKIHFAKEPYAIYISEALYMGIEALEKRMPKKPQTTIHKYRQENTEELGEHKMTHCPYCFWEDEKVRYFDSLVDKGTKYCRRCGQALDWSPDPTEKGGDEE